MGEVQTIPARRGSAAFVQQRQMVKAVNFRGEQGLDTWASCPHDILPVNATAGQATKGQLRISDPASKQGGRTA